MTTRDIRPGEAVRLHWGTDRQADYLAQSPCDDGRNGHWYCATHPGVHLPNNISMSSHVEGPGRHVEVWICHQHGPEAPYKE